MKQHVFFVFFFKPMQNKAVGTGQARHTQTKKRYQMRPASNKQPFLGGTVNKKKKIKKHKYNCFVMKENKAEQNKPNVI